MAVSGAKARQKLLDLGIITWKSVIYDNRHPRSGPIRVMLFESEEDLNLFKLAFTGASAIYRRIDFKDSFQKKHEKDTFKPVLKRFT